MANNCKIFTPNSYVVELLDAVGYREGLMGRSILENSCGEGNILKEIVRRYIQDAQLNNRTHQEIKLGLERDICGFELEQSHAERCRKNLAAEAEKVGIEDVRWNIVCQNYLTTKLDRKFFYIIGNPPYIVYRDIDKDERDYLREKFQTCREGKFDYYYAFIEKSVQDLEENGKMAYIIPDSIYKNVYAALLREYIKPFLEGVYDYTIRNKFPGTTISSNILLMKKQEIDQFFYYDVVEREKIQIKKEDLGEKWIFTEKKTVKKKIRFGSWFQVSNTVATLCNDAFLLENYKHENGYYVLPDGDKVEESIVNPALSRKRRNRECVIIFPYYYDNGILRHYTEDEFERYFPFATVHLQKFLTRLKKRAADKSAKWFEYGRSQALDKIQYKKAVIPSILSSNIHVTITQENVVPCAGVIITARGERTLEEAKKILESQKFYEYLKQIGIFTTGKSRRLTVKDIENYTFDSWK